MRIQFYILDDEIGHNLEVLLYIESPVFVAHGKGNHAFLSKLCAATFFGIEMVLSRSAGRNLAILGDFQSLSK